MLPTRPLWSSDGGVEPEIKRKLSNSRLMNIRFLISLNTDDRPFSFHIHHVEKIVSITVREEIVSILGREHDISQCNEAKQPAYCNKP